MLLSKLAKSGKTPFWAREIQGSIKGSLIASESEDSDLPNTILDVYAVKANGQRVLGTVSLSSAMVQNMLYSFGVEIDDDEEACGVFANILLEACDKGITDAEQRGEALILHCNYRDGDLTLPVLVNFRVVASHGAINDDIARMLQITIRKPRKEISKKRLASHTTHTGDTCEDASAVPTSDNVSQKVKVKRKKGLKI